MQKYSHEVKFYVFFFKIKEWPIDQTIFIYFTARPSYSNALFSHANSHTCLTLNRHLLFQVSVDGAIRAVVKTGTTHMWKLASKNHKLLFSLAIIIIIYFK